MLSLKDGIPICVVKGGKSNKTIVFLNDNINLEKRKLAISDGKFQQLPSEKTRVIYIAGPAGSGKSTYVAEYVKLYKKLYPDAKIILFSKVEDDPAFEDIDFKVIPIDEDLVENPLQIEEATDDTLFVFDDIDTISDKNILKSLQNFISQCMELGRHKNIQCIITSHLINGNDKKYTRTIMNELHTLTIFPHSGSSKSIKYCLGEYFDIEKKDIQKILQTNSRWVTIYRTYPKIILTENKVAFADNF